MNLTGRVAIVTGAGRGLGKAISLAFELSGANVALFSLLKDELDVRTECQSNYSELEKSAYTISMGIANPIPSAWVRTMVLTPKTFP